MPADNTPNPLLEAWTTPHETPPFAVIRPEHFRPAFDRAMADHIVEIEAIVACPEAPSFANTIGALERSGRALDRVSAVFHALAGAHTSDVLMAIEREMSPLLAAHRNRVRLHDGLYARIKALRDQSDSIRLSSEEARVLERYDTTFRRAGAGLPADAKGRIAAIEERLAALGTAFSQNVLADEQAYALFLDSEEDLGRPERRRTRISGRRRSGAGPARQACDHPGAVQRRAVSALFGAARPAGEGIRGLGGARQFRRRDRQQGHHC
jgi:peptidyl-dipeptidase Dcp